MAEKSKPDKKDDKSDRVEPVFRRPRMSQIDQIINLIDDCLGDES